MSLAIVVLGGNAFSPPGRPLTMAGQFQFAREAMNALLPLFREDVQLLLSHGNGPQVGHILTRVEQSLGKAYAIPLEVCVAESEGELGYVLEQSLYNVLHQNDLSQSIISLLTQVVVSPEDPAFQDPTKPIGPFFDRQQADLLSEKGIAVCEDAGRGYRRIVPSPHPLEIIEIEVIRSLLQSGVIVIAAGGGGIPVVRRKNSLQGVEAVIDKDLTAALLGEELGAQLLVILTGAPCAYRFFGTAEQDPIGCISAEEAKLLLAEGHFAIGSMAPKIEAAIAFASRPGRKTIICDPPSLSEALREEKGTIITGE